MVFPDKKLDRITVITINFNMAEELAQTIESVLAQSYPNLEYVVIDGGSRDGSVEVLASYSAQLDHWVSERDRGRYHAMNKGVEASTGDWVIFMNAGDRFHDEKVISDMFASRHDGADLVFGHALRFYPQLRSSRLVKAGPDSMLPRKMNCSHQALFTRRSVLLSHPFDEDLAIVADTEFMIWSKLSGKRFEMVDRVVCCFSGGGISDQRRYRALREQWEVLNRYRVLTSFAKAKFILEGGWQVVSGLLRNILPAPVVKFVLARKRGRGAAG